MPVHGGIGTLDPHIADRAMSPIGVPSPGAIVRSFIRAAHRGALIWRIDGASPEQIPAPLEQQRQFLDQVMRAA